MANSARDKYASVVGFRPVRPLADARTLIGYGRDLYIESLGSEHEFRRSYGVYGQRFPMWIAACAARDPAFAVFLIKEGSPIGLAAMGVSHRQGPKGLVYGHVHHFYVGPAHRGRGYGGLLDDYARETLQKAGCMRAQLNVTRTNTRAIRFYLAQGWQDVSAPSRSTLRQMEVAL